MRRNVAQEALDVIGVGILRSPVVGARIGGVVLIRGGLGEQRIRQHSSIVSPSDEEQERAWPSPA